MATGGISCSVSQQTCRNVCDSASSAAGFPLTWICDFLGRVRREEMQSDGYNPVGRGGLLKVQDKMAIVV